MTYEAPFDTQSDARTLAAAFKQIQAAALVINEVLDRNNHLNSTIPTNWPLSLSDDGFVAKCGAMVDHYDTLADRDDQ
jgi:hypothetical protein